MESHPALATSVPTVPQPLGMLAPARLFWGMLALAFTALAAALWFWEGNVAGDGTLTSAAMQRRMTAVVLAAMGGAGWLGVLRPGSTRDELRLFWVTNLLVGGLLSGILLVAWPAQAKFLPGHQTDLGFALAGLSLGALILAYRRNAVLHDLFGDHRRALGSFLLVFGFCLALGQMWERHRAGEDLQGIGLLGVITLLTVLLAGSALTGASPLSVRHVRTAITVSTLAVFFGIVGFGADRTMAPDSVLGKALENFWAVLMAVVGFYFGGETWERVAHAKRGAVVPDEDAAAPKTP
ncbi:MAG TPA: hypothetical protein VM241_05850 [Candidatus Thermoplasmatota archaeon]|nr:hypothetical protein [Candidatus Thermoplasmatota archaeon]